jgi:hypothetical protein
VAGDKYKVFISWSGDTAKAVAFVWSDLLRETFDVVEPFMSEDDIGAGRRNLVMIAEELAGTKFGIVVVTKANEHTSWINFEAGALSKDVHDETVRVAPSMVDFEHKGDLTGPLKQFQGGLLTQEGVEFILSEIAEIVGADISRVKTRFRRSWADYGPRFADAKAVSDDAAPTDHRDPPDKLDEILTTVRELSLQLSLASAQANTAQSNASLALAMLKRNSLDNTYHLESGDYVRHQRFGAGTVEAVDGIGLNALSVIDFGSRVGRKTLRHNREPMWKVADLPQVQLPEPENLSDGPA